MHNLEAAQLDELVAALGDMAASRALDIARDIDTSRWIMDSIRVILGGSRNTPKIDRAIVGLDATARDIADMYNTQ